MLMFYYLTTVFLHWSLRTLAAVHHYFVKFGIKKRIEKYHSSKMQLNKLQYIKNPAEIDWVFSAYVLALIHLQSCFSFKIISSHSFLPAYDQAGQSINTG